MKSILVAALIVGFAGVAGAAEVKKNTKAPGVASKAMTEKDMDKVTAGVGGAAYFSLSPNYHATLPDAAYAGRPMSTGVTTGGYPTNYNNFPTTVPYFGPL